jgi:hypothetical protein
VTNQRTGVTRNTKVKSEVQNCSRNIKIYIHRSKKLHKLLRMSSNTLCNHMGLRMHGIYGSFKLCFICLVHKQQNVITILNNVTIITTVHQIRLWYFWGSHSGAAEDCSRKTGPVGNCEALLLGKYFMFWGTEEPSSSQSIPGVNWCTSMFWLPKGNHQDDFPTNKMV